MRHHGWTLTKMGRVATAVLAATLIAASSASGAVRFKDIGYVAGPPDVQLFGYGLVVGLSGTGDGPGTQFTIQSLTNMLNRMGIKVDPGATKVKNAAAVMVTARLTPWMKVGSRFDVTASSLGDAKSLQGGTLLLTPLTGADGIVYASAQGPISTGGFNIEGGGGTSIQRNHTLVGRVPGGGAVEMEMFQLASVPEELRFVMHDPDYTTARRVVDAVNAVYPQHAMAVDASAVRIRVPSRHHGPGGQVAFIAALEHLEVEPDNPARVVINEKTGTIVAGEHVTLAPVALAHGGITVRIHSRPVISQPAPFSKGETVVEQQSNIVVTDENAQVVFLEESTKIQDVAEALNSIGASPRDIIAIFQAFKEAGALRAELVIL